MQNPQLENDILAILLSDPGAIRAAGHKLTIEHFQSPDNRKIFRACERLLAANVPIDLLSVSHELGGGAETRKDIVALSSSYASSANLDYLVEKIDEQYIARKYRRELERQLEELDENANRGAITRAQESLASIQTATTNGIVSIAEGLREWREQVYREWQEGVVPGIQTGFFALDEIIGGFQPEDLVVIAARPAMGKSAFVLDLALNAATAGKTILVFSQEMNIRELLTRIISGATEIPGMDFTRLRLREGDWTIIDRAIEALSGLPIFFDDSFGITVPEIAAKCRAQKELAMCIVDYLQLLESPEGDQSDNRTLEVGKQSRGLKALARELKIPVIVLSSVNRACEARQDKRPILSDLRESGNIEADANKVMAIYRDEVYNPETDRRGEVELIVRKNRGGPIGTATLLFQSSITKFISKEKVLC